MVSTAVLALLMYIVSSVMASGMRAQRYANRLTRATEIVQDLSDDLRRDLTSSVRLFPASAESNAYLAALDMRGAKPVLPSRLPELDETGIFEQEASGSTKSGNSLLFGRQAWTTVLTPVAGGATYRIDVYRLVYYYPASAGSGPAAGSSIGLDFCRFVSEPLADGDQIDAITDPTDQVGVLLHLLNRTPDDDGRVHPRCEVVWLRNGAVTTSGSLRQILPSGALDVAPQPPRATPWEIERDARLSSNSLLDYRRHSLASIYAPASYGVGKFSQVLTTGSGFPHGFETQLIGPASARQILLRLIGVTTEGDDAGAVATLQTVVDARDL